MGDLSGASLIAPVLTVVGSLGAAYLTTRASIKRSAASKEARVAAATADKEAKAEKSRSDRETEAYSRAESYWQNALRDARRELAEEKQERRDEVNALNRALGEERMERQQETAELRRRLTEAEARADRAESAARALARRNGERYPDPDSPVGG